MILSKNEKIVYSHFLYYQLTLTEVYTRRGNEASSALLHSPQQMPSPPAGSGVNLSSLSPQVIIASAIPSSVFAKITWDITHMTSRLIGLQDQNMVKQLAQQASCNLQTAANALKATAGDPHKALLGLQQRGPTLR